MWKDFVESGVAIGVGGGVPEERSRVGGVPGQPVERSNREGGVPGQPVERSNREGGVPGRGVQPKGVMGVFAMCGVRGDRASALVANATARLVATATGRLARRGTIGLCGRCASSRRSIIASCWWLGAGVIGTSSGRSAHRSGHHSG